MDDPPLRPRPAPSEPAASEPAASEPAPTWREVRLPFRPPLPLHELVTFFGLRAVPGVEEVSDGRYVRSLRLPGGIGVVAIESASARRADERPGVVARMRLPATGGAADLDAAVAATRRALDLDADPVAVDADLGSDPLLAPLVAATPGRRAPGHADGAELAVRAVLGQQVSLLAARRLAGDLTELCGDPVPGHVGGVTRAFPAPAAIAEADLDRIGMPRTRRSTLRTLARLLADGDIALGPDADPHEVERRLLEIRGIGPWTAAYVRMRGLGDRDVLLTTDLGVRHALDRLGAGGVDPALLARRWSPWGSYAVHHLWASLTSS